MRTGRVATLLLLVSGFAASASGCFFSGSKCEQGTSECVGASGAYRQCDGGEGFYSWRELQCPGVDPVCSVVSYQIRCEDRAQPEACPAESVLVRDAKLSRVIDWDRDGKLDLQLLDGFVARGNGLGQFEPPRELDVKLAGKFSDAYPLNLNADDEQDLVVITEDPREIYAFHGTNTLEYTLANRYFVSSILSIEGAADLDGDGRDELVAVTSGEGVHIFSDLGGPELRDQLLQTRRSRYGAYSVQAEIVDVDGALPPELVVHADYESDVYARNADGSYRRLETVRDGSTDAPKLELPYEARTRHVADFDGNGIDDLVVTVESASGRIWVLFYSGLGNADFAKPVVRALPESFDKAWGFTAADIDGNGRSDLVVWRRGDVVALPSACVL